MFNVVVRYYLQYTGFNNEFGIAEVVKFAEFVCFSLHLLSMQSGQAHNN